MTEKNIFTEDKGTIPESAVAPQETEPTLVDQLVGEGKKFKTVEGLAKGKQESDTFIDKLLAEKRELEAQLEKKKDSEKLIADLKKELNTSLDPQVNTTPALDQDAIVSLVEKTITAREQTMTTQQRLNEAQSLVVKHTGDHDKAKEFIANKAKDLGVSPEFLGTVGAQSPKAFAELLGINKEPALKQPSSADTPLAGSTVPAEQGNGPRAEKGTKAYYEWYRKNDRKTYFSAAMQAEIHKASQAGTYFK